MGTKPGDFLRFYAERLRTVELNTTGYRLPAQEQFERWAAQTSPGFRFVPKLPAHRPAMLGAFAERARALGDRLGPVRAVVQSARDEGLLELLLGSLPGLRLALDLRHPSWDGIEPHLHAAGAARVNAEAPGAPFRYLRFREPPYDDTALAALAERVGALLAEGTDVYCFFRHEDEPTAPVYAERLLALVGA